MNATDLVSRFESSRQEIKFRFPRLSVVNPYKSKKLGNFSDNLQSEEDIDLGSR